ncbi:hypothetical protein I79_008065 [Cricetulus griseus]|uniref:Uncharacterized protein n=1 Tax=Cricetulus griseus TaxID=10029 RepID=G3HC22_CRIGR|nr:hypothetical protein I79_008065 [Cricetulus griseus]
MLRSSLVVGCVSGRPSSRSPGLPFPAFRLCHHSRRRQLPLGVQNKMAARPTSAA